MSKSVEYNQSHEAYERVTGEIVSHKPGIEIRVEWTPGQAETTRADVMLAIEKVLVSIRDEEDA